MVSPFNDFVGLTRPGPGVDPSLPAALYPTGVRNFVRVFPTDDLEGAALALLARDRGRTRVFVLDDGDPGYGALQATAFETAAQPGRAARSWGGRLGIRERTSTRRSRVGSRDSGADCRLRRRPHRYECGRRASGPAPSTLRDDVDLLGPGGLAPSPLLMQKSEGAARGMYLSFPGFCPEPASRRGPLGDTLRRHAARGRTSSPRPSTPRRRPRCSSTQSRARTARVARSSTSCSERASADGLLGSFGFDANGDISESPMTIVQVRRGGSDNRVQSVERRAGGARRPSVSRTRGLRAIAPRPPRRTRFRTLSGGIGSRSRPGRASQPPLAGSPRPASVFALAAPPQPPVGPEDARARRRASGDRRTSSPTASA